MKAIAVRPGQPHSVHLREIEKPTLAKFPNGDGVLVKVLKVGVDATDREINDALYGNPPPAMIIWCWGTNALESSKPSVTR